MSYQLSAISFEPGFGTDRRSTAEQLPRATVLWLDSKLIADSW